MRFDITLKDLLQATPVRLFELLTGATPVELLTVEFPSVGFRKPDFMARLSDGRLYHLEILSNNEEDSDVRMFEYSALAYRLFREIPYQQILYVGEAPMRLKSHIDASWGTFSFETIDIRQLSAEQLLASQSLPDTILALLGGAEDLNKILSHIAQRLRALPANQSNDAWQKLVILSELRRFEAAVESEKLMPLNLMDFKMTRDMYYKGEREGVQKGEGQMLRLMLERRFGPLPAWVEDKLCDADNASLESWGIRLLDANTLEAVFHQ